MPNFKEKDYAADRHSLITENKLGLKTVFIPHSQSRHKDDKDLQLNWKITLLRNEKEIVTTDYSQGIGHAPSYKNPPRNNVGIDKYTWVKMQQHESETGKKALVTHIGTSQIRSNGDIQPPKIEDILYSLILDSDVLDYSSYGEWCSNFGYDEDSRKGEKIYHDCLAIALKMRAGLGDKLVTELRESFTDY